MKALIIFNFCI